MSSSSISVKGATLPGYYPRDFPSSLVVDVGWYIHKSPLEFVQWLCSGTVMSSCKGAQVIKDTKVDIYDARKLEAEEGLSKADFFNKWGFVVLDSKVSLTADDWVASTLDMSRSIDNNEQLQAENDIPTPAKMKYAKELEPVVKQLVPTATKFFSAGRGVRRGPGGYEVFSAAVHTDFPFDNFDDAAANPFSPFNVRGFDKEKEAFLSNPKAKGWMLLNFWRPVLPMQHPLADQNQLCFADPNSIDKDDFVKVTLYGQVGWGQDYLNLKLNPKHKWYHYPNMTTDEVLVFKQGDFPKGQVQGEMPVPHSGFISPGATSKDSEPRCSFEYRIGFIYE